VTELAIGNVGKQDNAATGGHGGDGHGTAGCCDANQKPRSHDTSRIAWAKLMARVGEAFCVSGVWSRHPTHRVTPKPGPIRKILTHFGEPLEPPLVSHPARSVPAVAPRDPPRSADPCRRAIGRPILAAAGETRRFSGEGSRG
jgi:hypothetical protein